MKFIDEYVIKILNAWGHNSDIFNSLMFMMIQNNLVKGGGMIVLLWYIWFSEKNKWSYVREQILICWFSCLIAVIVGRSIPLLLPYRPRPILNPGFYFPFKIDAVSWLNRASSFPSDHAVLYFSMATGIFTISRKWGIISFAYVLIFICFPRIYLGFHYPTDILGGALIGIFITWIISIQKSSHLLSQKSIALSIKFPGIFYACFFLLTYQFTTQFQESRDLCSFFIHSIQKIISLFF